MFTSSALARPWERRQTSFNVDADQKRKESLKADANRLRGLILALDKDLMTFKACVQASRNIEGVDMGEVIATTVLAHRQLEMGRMWLGKSIQALDGGVSIFDRQPTEQQQQ
jgi:hypothetical protein